MLISVAPLSRTALHVGRFVTNAAIGMVRRTSSRRSFDSAGVRVHYTDEGRGSPVVLLHGFAVTADLNWRWPGVTRELARDHRVISMDLRGHGRSDKPQGAGRYGERMVSDVTRLLDHLGIERAHVAGYSLGGFVALKLASVATDRLFSAAVLGAGWESPENGAFLAALPKLAADLERGQGIGPLMQGLGSERARPTAMHHLWVKVMTRYFNDPHALVGVIRGTPALAVSEDELGRIEIPILSVVGERDPMLAPARAMVGKVRDHRLVIVREADHIEAPMRAEFVEALQVFMRAAE
jgi:pimeloyl-ACP methyl ester carboxylesterase